MNNKCFVFRESCLGKLEARIGVEPTNKGFAALYLAISNPFTIIQVEARNLHAVHRPSTWSI